MQKYQQIAQLLEKTFSEQNSNTRKIAEEQLKLNSKQDLKYSEVITQIIISSEFSDQVKKAACIQFKNHVHEFIQFQNYEITHKQFHISNIYKILLSEIIDVSIKVNLTDLLSTIIDLDFDGKIRDECVEQINTMLQQLTQMDQFILSKIEGILLIIQSLFYASVNNSVDHAIFYNKIMIHYLLAFEYILQVLSEQLGFNNQKYSYEYVLDIFVLFCQNIKLGITKVVLHSSSEENFQQLSIFLKNEKFAKIIYGCLMQLDLQNQLEYNNNLIIKLYKGNAKLISSLEKIVSCIINAENKNTQILEQSVIFQNVQVFLQFLINKLAIQKYKQIDLPLESSSYFIEGMNLLTTCTQITKFYNFFEKNYKFLVLHVLFNFIASFQTEIDKMISDPSEFVSLALDTVDKQVSKCLKTEAAKMCENLCDHIDGALSYISDLCIGIIYKVYNMANQQAQLSQNLINILLQAEATPFFQQNGVEIQLDVALHVITLLSYLIPKRMQSNDDIFYRFQRCIYDTQQILTNAQNQQLIQARVCMMFGYYYDNLFQDEIQGVNDLNAHIISYQNFVNFLITCLHSENQGVVLQSIDSLTNVLQDEDIQPIIQSIYTKIFLNFVQLIQQMQQKGFFEMIQEIIQQNGQLFCNEKTIILELINSLSNRIQKDLVAIDNDKNKIIIAKCFNILKVLAQSKYFIPTYSDIIESSIMPFLQNISNPILKNFDEDIVQICIDILKISHSVTNCHRQLFMNLKQLLQFNDGIMADFFEFCNYIIVYDVVFFQQNPELIKNAIDIADIALFSKSSKQNVQSINQEIVSQSDQSQGALLLQLIIQYSSEVLSQELMEIIFNLIIQRINFQQQLNYPFKAFFISRLMGVFYCAFIQNFELSQQILIKYNKLNYIFDLMLKAQNDNQDPYEKKLFVTCMSKLLINNNLHQEIRIKMLEALGAVVNTLIISQIVEKRVFKKNYQFSGSCFLDQQDNDHDNQIIISIRGMYQYILQKLQLFFKSQKEFYDEYYISSKQNIAPFNKKNSLILDESENNFSLNSDTSDDDKIFNSLKTNEYVNLIQLTFIFKQQEAKKNIQKFVSNFKQIDEFTIFRDVCIRLKQQNADQTEQFFKQLSSDQQKYLFEVLYSQRIVESQDIVVRKIVKVKKKKKN